MYTVLKLIQPFEGNHKADVATSETELDTPGLDFRQLSKSHKYII